jgi:outer membrane protein assembly factor BamC
MTRMTHSSQARAHSLRLVCGVLLLTLSACASVVDDKKVDYKNTQKPSNLETPPDLTALKNDPRFAPPAASVSANALNTGDAANDAGQRAATLTPNTAIQSIADVQFMRAGQERWLKVNRSAESLWEPLKEFWKENGFTLAQEQAALGIMETEWAENRAKIPQDFIRNSIGKLFDGLYSTGERDKFRTRLERAPDGSTEIYITHRGLSEDFVGLGKESLRWGPRPTDPELEIEFLRRLMVKIGGYKEDVAKATITEKSPSKAGSRVIQQSGVYALPIDEPLDRAWRRVGVALDRSGFTVEDRDRASGLYFVRILMQRADEKKSFFSGLFSGKNKSELSRYRIILESMESKTFIRVQNADATAAPSRDVQQILKLLENELF